MKYVVIPLLSLSISVLASIMVINSGVLHGRMVQEIRSKTGAPIELGRIKIPFQWPPTVLVLDTKVPMGDLHFEFKSAVVTIGSFISPYDFRIYLREPKVIVKGPIGGLTATSRDGSPPPVTSAGSGSGAKKKFRLLVNIMDGELHSEDLNVTKLNLEFDQKQWMKTPARIKASARVRSQMFPGELPVAVQTDSLVFNEESVKAAGVKASFAGLNAEVQGTSLLKDGRHRWVAEVKAPDLSQVPAPFDIPASGWQGAIELNADLTKESAAKPWAAEGRAILKGVKANLKWKNDKASINGPIALDARGSFVFADQKITVPALSGYADLELAQVEAAGILNKPAHVPLRLDISADGSSEHLNIRKLEARLWQLKAEMSGQIAMTAPFDGHLVLDLKPTPLKGLEALITPLKNSLVQGEVAVQGEWTGPMTDPWASKIVIKNLRLKNFSADVNYDTGGAVKAKGPIAATVEAVGEIDKGKPKSLQASGSVQLGGLSLVAGPLRKESNQPLAASFKFRSDGVALNIDQLAITGFLGTINGSGTLSEPLNPKINLRLAMSPLSLSELRVAIPEYRELIPKGSVSGQVTLLGQVASGSPWNAWPLNVGGNVKVSLPEYRIATAPPSAGGVVKPASGGAAVNPVVPPEGFLPKGHLTENLNMQVAASIGILTKDELTIKGLESSGRIAKGKFVGNLSIGEIFGGKVNVTNTSVPLLEPLPTIQGQIALEQIIVQDALAFTKPEYKTMATGRAAGQSSFTTKMPSDPKFMDALKAKGQMTLQPITLNTVKIGEMLNDLIKKVPVLKLPPAKVEPLKGMVKADFSLESQAVTLAPLYARDEDGSELDLQGKVILATMQGDLAGNFFWVNPQVKGCLLESNADKQGRLVVPLALKGNLMKPELAMVSDTVNKLAGRALECEKVKLVEQIKKDGGKKLEQEAKKVLKGILGK